MFVDYGVWDPNGTTLQILVLLEQVMEEVGQVAITFQCVLAPRGIIARGIVVATIVRVDRTRVEIARVDLAHDFPLL